MNCLHTIVVCGIRNAPIYSTRQQSEIEKVVVCGIRNVPIYSTRQQSEIEKVVVCGIRNVPIYSVGVYFGSVVCGIMYKR